MSSRVCQRPVWLCDVLSGNSDESTSHIQSGRQALVSHGQPSVAALAVGRQRALLSSRHVAGAALACVRPAGSVSSSVAVVAAVRVQLPVHHRLGVPATPPAAMSRFAAFNLQDETNPNTIPPEINLACFGNADILPMLTYL